MSVPINVSLSNPALLSLPDGFALSEMEDADIWLSDAIADGIPSFAFKVYVCKEKPTAFSQEIADYFDAWLLQTSPQSLNSLVANNEKIINRSTKLRKQIKLLEELFVADDLNAQNCAMIKDHMHHSVGGIRNIFQEQVKVMRSVHDDIKETKGVLEAVKSTHDSLEREALLVDAISNTQDILVQTDGVVNAMYGFVTILQCEDRIAQILNGVINVLQDGCSKVKTLDACPDESKIQDIKNNLVKHYTIQEQRDMALGNEVKMQYCEAKPSLDDDDIDMLLF